MEKNIGFNRNVIEGIYAFSQKEKNWIFYDAMPHLGIEQTCQQWQLDAVVGHFYNESIAAEAELLNIPVVNTTDSLVGCKMPLADVNHFSVGQMAGEYFVGLGMKSFGYLGHHRLQFSKQRQSAFLSRVSAVGPVSVCHAAYTPRIEDAREAQEVREVIKQWVMGLPKPVGVFCSNDIPARDLADACLELGIEVPNQVSILGVDNDFLEVRLARPPLSSIDIPAARIGYAAAQMIDSRLKGESDPYDSHYTPDAVQVVERESTAMHAVEDELVRDVLDYMKEHLSEVHQVEDVVKCVPLSRRALEIRFKQALGKSVWEVVLEKRMHHARLLLLNSTMHMQQIAEACGFASLRRFYAVFQKYNNCSPAIFRKSCF